MRSLWHDLTVLRQWLGTMRQMPRMLAQLRATVALQGRQLDVSQQRLDVSQQRLGALQVQQHQALAALQQDLGELQAQLDASQTLARKRLDALEPLHQLLPHPQLPFALHAAAPEWLQRAEARVGRPLAQLGTHERAQAFYTYYSEIGGDQRPVLHQQYQTYLPLLQQAWHACNSAAPPAAQHLPACPVLDIGCGAGEFLQFLREHAIQAVGIDQSATEVQRCQAAGLQALQADALAHLQHSSQTYAAITLLQVIEHLPSEHITPLLQACVDRLAPGGLLLVETVNLRHPLALNGFYTDPTHRTPLSDNYLSFLLQWLGLQQVGLIYTLPEPVAALQASSPTGQYCNYSVYGLRT